jgi:hypothetical protein
MAMNGNDLIVRDPRRLFELGHVTFSFRQSSQRVPVFVHNFVGDLHRLFEVRIVGQKLKAAARQLSYMKLLATLEVHPLHQLTRKDNPIGIADSFDLELH